MTRPANLKDGTIFPAFLNNGSQINDIIYVEGESYLRESFKDIRFRAVNDFEKYSDFSKANPEFGVNRECLSKEIRDFQDSFYKKYRD